MSNETVILPRKLSADNGARELLAGEFWIDEENRKIMIPWESIEAIYEKIVEGLEIK